MKERIPDIWYFNSIHNAVKGWGYCLFHWIDNKRGIYSTKILQMKGYKTKISKWQVLPVSRFILTLNFNRNRWTDEQKFQENSLERRFQIFWILKWSKFALKYQKFETKQAISVKFFPSNQSSDTISRLAFWIEIEHEMKDEKKAISLTVKMKVFYRVKDDDLCEWHLGWLGMSKGMRSSRRWWRASFKRKSWLK